MAAYNAADVCPKAYRADNIMKRIRALEGPASYKTGGAPVKKKVDIAGKQKE